MVKQDEEKQLNAGSGNTEDLEGRALVPPHLYSHTGICVISSSDDTDVVHTEEIHCTVNYFITEVCQTNAKM